MAKDQDYEAAVEKGTKLMQMLTEKVKISVQSVFKHTEEMTQYDYHLKPQQTSFEIEYVAEALRDLGFDDKMVYDGGENVKIRHVHDRGGKVDGEEYATTCGYFSQAANPHAGVLIADSNLSPSHAAAFSDTEEEEDKDLPSLLHWSDVAFLQCLSSFTSTPMRSIPLNYVFRVQIQNSETFLVLNKVIKMHGYSTYELWPGITFDIKSEEGRAILGTPNGGGVAWMLIQHSTLLGERTVEKLSVFYAPMKGDLLRWPSLLFWIM